MLHKMVAHDLRPLRRTVSALGFTHNISVTPSPFSLPSPLFPPTFTQTPAWPCPWSVDSTNEKTPFLSPFLHGSSIGEHAPLSGTISANKVSAADFVGAAQLLLAALTKAVKVKIKNLIEKCIDIFTDDDREDKDELLFPLGSWDGDSVGQAGEAVCEVAMLEGVLVKGVIKDGGSVTEARRNLEESRQEAIKMC